MDNPVDNIVDLGFVNYVRHPTNPDYVVYRFADVNRADSFEEALKEAGIEYERDQLVKKTVTYHLIGIHKNDYKHTVKINFHVEAKHKKPLIPYKAFRYFLIAFSIAALTLAGIGYCKQQEKLTSFNHNTPSVNTSDTVEE